MASDLPSGQPARSPERLDGVFAGDVGKLSQFLNRYQHLDPILGVIIKGALILSPEPSGNGFLDVGKGFLFVPTLRDTAG